MRMYAVHMLGNSFFIQVLLSGGCRIVSSKTQFKFSDVKLKLQSQERALYIEVMHTPCKLSSCM